jgi:hypothetical protein
VPKQIPNSYLPKKIQTAPKAATLTTIGAASNIASIQHNDKEKELKDDSKVVVLIQGNKRVVPKIRLDRAL